jgi:hypothetical protein
MKWSFIITVAVLISICAFGGYGKDAQAAGTKLSFVRSEHEIEVSTTEGQKQKVKVFQYQVVLPASAQLPPALRGIEVELKSITTSGFMQAANLSGALIQSDSLLRELATSLNCEVPAIPMKTHVVFAVSCKPGLAVGITVDYIQIRNGQLDGIVCTYELSKDKAAGRKPLTLVAVPIAIVGEVKGPKSESPLSQERKE